MSIPVSYDSLFFFSSRRRHTRFSRDWSSDVCSSDLPAGARDHDHAGLEGLPQGLKHGPGELGGLVEEQHAEVGEAGLARTHSAAAAHRSEERRVGKECRSRWSPHDEKKKDKQERGSE